MLNPNYKSYYYGLWLIKLNDESDPFVFEGRYKTILEEVKNMDGFCDDTTIEAIKYRNFGHRKVEINEVWIAKHEYCPNGVIGIDWAGEEGFGRYELILEDDGKLHARTEYMDSDKQKLFSRDVLNAILRDIVIDD